MKYKKQLQQLAQRLCENGNSTQNAFICAMR